MLGNKWIAAALISATVGCESPDFMQGWFWIRVGINGGYVAFAWRENKAALTLDPIGASYCHLGAPESSNSHHHSVAL